MKCSSRMLRLCTAIVLSGSLGALVQAQNREKFVISARAGGVNSVSGRVVIKQAGQSERLLTDQDNLSSGDVVRTASGARSEVLLNPGSYLRVGKSSEFELADNSLENLRVKLTKGSAIVEATGIDNAELRIAFVTDQGRFVIARPGVYRINVQPGATELSVRKGRVWIGDNPREVVKGGNKVIFNSGPILTAKLAKKDQDEFDVWSKERAETLARANQKLSARALNTYLANFNYWDWAFSAANPWGLWAYSPFSRCFTFLPFYYGWASPYGHYYGQYYGVYDYFPGRGCCGVGSVRGPLIVNNPPPGGSSGGSSGGSAGGGIGSSPAGISAPSSPSRGAPRDPDSGGRAVRKLDPIN